MHRKSQLHSSQETHFSHETANYWGVNFPTIFGHFDSKHIQIMSSPPKILKQSSTLPHRNVSVLLIFLEYVIFGMFRSVIGHEQGHHSVPYTKKLKKKPCRNGKTNGQRPPKRQQPGNIFPKSRTD